MARLSINRVLLILAAFKMLQFIQGLGIRMGKIILTRKVGGKEVGRDLVASLGQHHPLHGCGPLLGPR